MNARPAHINRGRTDRMYDFEKRICWHEKNDKDPLLPILYAFSVMGYLPFTRDKTGLLHFRFLSLPVVWAVAVTTFQVSMVIKIYLWRLFLIQESQDFDHIFNVLTEMLFLNTSFHGVLATWRSTPKIVRAINRWKEFRVEVQSATRRPLTSVVLDRSHLGLIVVAGLVALEFIINYFFFTRLTLWENIVDAVYFVSTFYFNTFLLLWIVVCVMIEKSAELIKQHLMEVLSKHPSPDDILRVRRLWLELHDSTSDLVNALGPTLQMWKDLGFTVNLFALFGLFSVFSGVKIDYSYLIIVILNAGLAIFVAYALSDSAQNSVSRSFVIFIHTRRWLYIPDDIRIQLELFLEAVEMGKPCFEVRGLYTLDKACYISVLYAIITNLVVLMQFKVSSKTPD